MLIWSNRADRGFQKETDPGAVERGFTGSVSMLWLELALKILPGLAVSLNNVYWIRIAQLKPYGI